MLNARRRVSVALGVRVSGQVARAQRVPGNKPSLRWVRKTGKKSIRYSLFTLYVWVLGSAGPLSVLGRVPAITMLRTEYPLS